jgi:hypothetical protein
VFGLLVLEEDGRFGMINRGRPMARHCCGSIKG